MALRRFVSYPLIKAPQQGHSGSSVLCTRYASFIGSYSRVYCFVIIIATSFARSPHQLPSVCAVYILPYSIGCNKSINVNLVCGGEFGVKVGENSPHGTKLLKKRNTKNSVKSRLLRFCKVIQKGNTATHNPKVVWFKSCLRNQMESNPWGLLFTLSGYETDERARWVVKTKMPLDGHFCRTKPPKARRKEAKVSLRTFRLCDGGGMCSQVGFFFSASATRKTRRFYRRVFRYIRLRRVLCFAILFGFAE